MYYFQREGTTQETSGLDAPSERRRVSQEDLMVDFCDVSSNVRVVPYCCDQARVSQMVELSIYQSIL